MKASALVAEQVLPPSVIPAKAGIHAEALDSGSPFHSARNDGERGGCFLFPLCQASGDGWHPAGFGPLRELADASIRATNAGHPGPVPAG